MVQEVSELKEGLRRPVTGRSAVFALHQTKPAVFFLNLKGQTDVEEPLHVNISVGPEVNTKEVTAGLQMLRSHVDLHIYKTD